MIPADALTHLQAKLPAMTKWIIAREKHQDGHHHLHCYLYIPEGCNIASPTLLDLEHFHGNYQAVRSRKAVMKYVQKDGEFISNIEEKDLFPTDPYQEARSQAVAGQIEEAIQTLSSTPRACRDLVLYEANIRKNFQSLQRNVAVIRHPLDTFQWDQDWDRAQTLILWGPTATGKTALAKALIGPNPLLIRHLDILRTLTGTHTGVIFDDMSFLHQPREAQIHLVDTDEDTHIHIRYGVAVIPRLMPRIITTNLVPSGVLQILDPAIARRVQVVRVDGIGVYRSDDVPVYE